MLRPLFEDARSLLLLKEQTERNAAEIREIRQELRELAAVVQRVAYEVQQQRRRRAGACRLRDRTGGKWGHRMKRMGQ